MTQLERITEFLIKFRNERDWEQFHNPKDLAMALNIEAGELLERFLWKAPDEARPDKVGEELADVLVYALMLAHHYRFDVEQIIMDKMKHNGEKYPVEKAKGNAKKYNEF